MKNESLTTEKLSRSSKKMRAHRLCGRRGTSPRESFTIDPRSAYSEVTWKTVLARHLFPNHPTSLLPLHVHPFPLLRIFINTVKKVQVFSPGGKGGGAVWTVTIPRGTIWHSQPLNKASCFQSVLRLFYICSKKTGWPTVDSWSTVWSWMGTRSFHFQDFFSEDRIKGNPSQKAWN